MGTEEIQREADVLAEQVTYYQVRTPHCDDQSIDETRSDAGDGRDYRVVKIYYEPDELTAALEALGWRAVVGSTGRSCFLGWAGPPMGSP